MTSGPSLAVAFEYVGGDDKPSWKAWRELMVGLRANYADKDRSERNAVHGSDSQEAADRELAFFDLTEKKTGESWDA
jgi:nucleoside diphosphate kinase